MFFFYSGNANDTRGTAYVAYEDIFDAKNACDHLSGFNVCNRYLVVLYYQPTKVSGRHMHGIFHNMTDFVWGGGGCTARESPPPKVPPPTIGKLGHKCHHPPHQMKTKGLNYFARK